MTDTSQPIRLEAQEIQPGCRIRDELGNEHLVTDVSPDPQRPAELVIKFADGGSYITDPDCHFWVITDTTGSGSRWEAERDTRDGRVDTETDEQVQHLADALQKAWNEWVTDTGCVPDGFKIHGPSTTRVTADFAAGMAFVQRVQSWLPASPATPPFDARMEIERTLRDAQAKGAAVEGQAAKLMELVLSWQPGDPAADEAAIERMAEAARGAYWSAERAHPWSELDAENKALWISAARAALAALRGES